MKGLLVKNFIMIKKSLITSVIAITVILIMIFAMRNISEIIVISTLFSMIAMMYPVNNDYWKWERWSLEMPVTRKMIVTSKYLTSFLIIGACTILNGIVCLISVAVGICEPDAAMSVLLISVISSLLYTIISTPLILKLPQIFLWLVVCVSGVFMGGFFASVGTIPWQDIPVWSVLISLAAVIILIPVSWLLSVKIYENKDI